ncbi:MAG: hypothetical protein QW392_08410 [Candidatus Jordarchaeales archaeon]
MFSHIIIFLSFFSLFLHVLAPGGHPPRRLFKLKCKLPELLGGIFTTTKGAVLGVLSGGVPLGDAEMLLHPFQRAVTPTNYKKKL